MYIDPDLRDRVYQLFGLEVPKMLQTIETELVTLSVDRSVTKVNNLLRAAHSIKGGAASLGLVEIVELAHQVEDIFRILSHPELPFDRQLERLLFQLYDCLARLVTCEIDREPLPDLFHTQTQIVLANIDDEIGHFVIAGQQTPNGIIAGTDLTQSIFEVDVAQSLARLERVLLDPQCERIAVGEFRAQSEVFIGIAQLINLPEFSTPARATIDALDRHPHRQREICCFALVNFYQALEAVLTNDRANCGKISPGFAFLLAEAPRTLAVAGAIDTRAEYLGDLELMFDVPGASADRHIAIDVYSTADRDILFDLERIFERDALYPLTPNDERTERSALSLDWEILDDDRSIVDLGKPIEQRELFVPVFSKSIERDGDLRFDVIELFDRPTQSFAVLERRDALGLDFDLIELFDGVRVASAFAEASQHESPATPSLSVLPLATSFDLIDLFDLPRMTTLPDGIHDRHTEIMAIVANVTHDFANLAPIDPQAFALTPKIAKPLRTKPSRPIALAPAPQLSVRVALDRLERMNNVIGELAIERHGLALYNEQVRANLLGMRDKCDRFQIVSDKLRQLADTLSLSTFQRSVTGVDRSPLASNLTEQFFDALELDRYSELHGIAQETSEQLAQIQEQIEDLDLFSTQSDRQIERQKQLLSYLRDDLMWARMLPLGEILNRFPRTLHDLSIEYQKPVDLKIMGAGVLVDRSTIDKLLDPLLHLLRNAFDHGIEAPDIRRAAGKPERGSIEITAYHQGSQTVIEIRDDGGGMDLDRIRAKAIALELPNAETATTDRLLDFIFTPGFSTSDRVTKLSGRGMGMDIVKAQIQTLKGTIFIDSELGRGTTFTLRIPLTLTIAQLMVCQVGRAVYAFPADSIHRIVIPTSETIAHRDDRRWLVWQDRHIPIYNLADLLAYSVPLAERTLSQTLKATIDNPPDWLSPLLLIRSGERHFALEIDRSLSEQELTIVPFSKGITPPSYSYGCTILGDGVILPVIDLHTLIRVAIDRPYRSVKPPTIVPQPQISTDLILVIDDSVTTRQSLCLSLEKFGYRTLQARDGQEALQLMRHRASELKLAICDVEMPNMNGFEFLNVRRQDATIAEIPVVMLTSRSSAKHRQFATHLGAIGYFIKPYIERDLMTAIDRLLRQRSSRVES
jgi:two-component system, chemotaxis family, sensor histidine kinase and response regulator PixL